MRFNFIHRKIRHPNILLLMGLYYDKKKKIQTFYEECVGSIFEVIHERVFLYHRMFDNVHFVLTFVEIFLGKYALLSDIFALPWRNSKRSSSSEDQ